MPLQRESQRISDFMNQQGWQYFVLITPVALHLVNAAAVAGMQLAESAGAPLSAGEDGVEDIGRRVGRGDDSELPGMRAA
jgi:hypothetical protein